MTRLGYLTIFGIVLGGIIHIVTVLLVPSYASKDAWGQLAQRGEAWETTLISLPGKKGQDELPGADPLFGVAACRFDLQESPLSIRAQGHLPFWSVALFSREGRNAYSFNDRTAIERNLFLIVVNPVQMALLRRNPPADAERAVVVETEIDEGFVLIRGLLEDPSQIGRVESFLTSIACDRYSIDDLESSGAT